MDNKEKFLFDLNDFSDDVAVNVEDEAPTFSEDELNQAREDSFKLGIEDATTKIRNEHEERFAQCLENVTQHLSTVLQAETRRELEKSIDTTRLTLSIVKKLMPHFSNRYSEDEIISLVKQSLHDRPEEPKIALVVHDTMLESLKEKIDHIAQTQAFQGQVVIIADDTIAQTDCRIEWADGGIEKEFKSLFASIETAFNTALQRANAQDLPHKMEPHIEKSTPDVTQETTEDTIDDTIEEITETP